MTWTRRDFLSAVAGSAVAAGVAARAQADDAALARFGAFPLAHLVDRLRTAVGRRDEGWRPTGLGRDEYLRIIQGIVRFFAPLQDERGAIIDPHEKTERQYSTPAFALAAAALAASGRDASVLPAAVRAMDTACADLADGRAADAHADFYTVLLLHADVVLRRAVAASAEAGWRRNLARVAPERVYRFQPDAQKLHNWNLVAAAGEWLRTREGLGQSERWIEASLDRQMEHFTPAGMYRDPSDPMAYDHFARLWVLDLVEEGYAGPHAALLNALVERGAWTSLFMQSPWGEAPCGGRSAHHQWNEAQQAVTFETMARRTSARGDRAAAGAFTRAARLSLGSIGRWVRPSGELWIVKNRFDPRLRHGYEGYSYHSQYNLLAAAMLALAWLRADPRAAEAPCPADVGGFGFALQPAFHKAFVAASGAFVEIDTGADPGYNPTGVLRIHLRDAPPEILSDGVTARAGYQLPSKPTRSLALGPAWRDREGAWHALAGHAGADLEPADVRFATDSRERVEAEICYRGRLRGGASAVRERIRVTSAAVEIEHEVEGDVDAVRQVFPLLLTDGARESAIAVQGRTVELSRHGGRITFEALGDRVTVARLGLSEPCRNGYMDAACAEAPGRAIRCRVFAGRRPA